MPYAFNAVPIAKGTETSWHSGPERCNLAYNAVPIAKGTETAFGGLIARRQAPYNAVPIAKGTETHQRHDAAMTATSSLQCCPHSEGD